MTKESPDSAEVTPREADAGVASESTDAKNMSKKSVAIGAAVGIGSAAIVAALLYSRRR